MDPLVSVVVPVYNNPRGIATALGALICQTYPAERFEVIVVDNGSTDETREVVKHLQDKNPGRIRLLVEDQAQGSYAARNKGIQHAQSEILAFTDADCIPARDWLEKGVTALTMERASVVAGHIEMTFQPGGPNIFEYLDASKYLNQRDHVEREHYGATANLFVRREAFAQHGLFRGDLRSGGDVEFGQRLTHAGEILIYAPDASVRHPARATLRALLDKEKRVSRGHRQLAELGLSDGMGITWRSFVPWARYRPVGGLHLSGWQRVEVRAFAILSKYYRLACLLLPQSWISERPSPQAIGSP